MRRESPIRDSVACSGLRIAAAVALSLAALLAGAGLALELTPTRLLVVTERPPALAARADPGDEADAAQAEADGDDEDADPERHDHPVTETALAAAPGAPVPAASSDPAAAGDPAASDARLLAASAGLPGAEAAPAPSPAPAPSAARVRPTPGPRGAPRATADLPIVMYHHVGPLPPNADAIRRDLTVSPELFESTLKRLAELQVETVTLAELMEHFAGGAELPMRAVALTFDDGYDDNYLYAFRLLRKYGMVGTFFVTTDFVERPGYLTWAQIAEMAEAGMAIEAHSADHADFTKIGPAALRRQLAEPKAYLEQATGQKVRFLAYPAGKYNAAVIAATREAGYEAAVTVLHGTRHTSSAPFELRRVRARGADTVTEIVARLTPASWRR